MPARRPALLPAVVLLPALIAACLRSEPVDQAAWLTRASMSVARDEFGAAVVDGKIYAIGGLTGERGNELRIVEVYDPQRDAWERRASLPRARAALRADAVGTTIYAIGGSVEEGVTGRVDAYDTRTDRWSERTPMPTPRLGLAVVAVEDKLYAIGGYRAGQALAAVEVYDPAADTWTARAPLPTPRYNLAAVAVGHEIYAIGGRRDGESLRTVEVYDARADRWRPGPALPTAMSNFSAALVGGEIHALLHRDHLALDLKTGRWRPEAPMRWSRHGLAATGLGDVLYAIGGCHEDLYDLAVTEAYRVRPPAGSSSAGAWLAGFGLEVPPLGAARIGPR